VLLLSNMPTRLTVDRLVTWDALMPDRLEQAILRTGGVLPLSASELARTCPDLWPSAEAVRMWRCRGSDEKGVTNPNKKSYWETLHLSEATVVEYRRPGQSRGSPHRAVLPGRVEDAAAATAPLATVVGTVEKVRLVEVLRRPGVRPARTSGAAEPTRLGEPPSLDARSGGLPAPRTTARC
jgi:hypothetical protein